MAHTIRILSINNIVQLTYNFNGKTFLSIFLLIPHCSIDRDREMKLTVSGESISRCEKAEYSQQIQRRKYKQTTASPHNNPLSLHTRFLLRLFHHHHSLKHYQHWHRDISNTISKVRCCFVSRFLFLVFRNRWLWQPASRKDRSTTTTTTILTHDVLTDYR